MKKSYERKSVQKSYTKQKFQKKSPAKKQTFYAKKVYGRYGTPDDKYWDFLKPKSEDFING